MLAVTPRKVVRTFRQSVRTIEQQHDSIIAALAGSGNRAVLEGILAQQFALELGVRWEGFIHDLFVAYLLKGKRAFVISKKESIRQSISSRFGDLWGDSIRIKSTGKWSPRVVENLLDPKERNITVESADNLYELATRLLGSKAISFSLDPPDRKLIDLVIALRNYLAHRSKSSLRKLNTAAESFEATGPNAGLGARIGVVGAYLRRPGTPGGHPRIKRLYARMGEIARKLV